ncbi:hypothetical protein UPYG_G00107500 [Umbra pygmaea]|uniref:Centriolar coiled-coil protein of 110 kDa-like n=1 Tax=Umbra pygmaea TaxID=75934 RepID=A0ABD0X2K1_UMBPY
MEMESYEDFCIRSLDRLKAESKVKQRDCEPTGPLGGLTDFIHFHGRAVLSPLLTLEQRRAMAQYRERAAKLEVDRQTLNRSGLLARVQNILDKAQAHKVPEIELNMDPSTPMEAVNGYTLVIESPGQDGAGLDGLQIAGRPDTSETVPTLLLNRYRAEKIETPAEKTKGEQEKRREEEVRTEQEVSLQSFLRRSREYVERENAQLGSKVMGRVTPTTPPANSLSDKENESRSPLKETIQEQGHGSLPSPPQTQPLYQTQARYQAAGEPYEPYTLLPSPKPSQSPKPHRRRPRPVSTGNIMISFPIAPGDLVPRGLAGRHPEGAVTTASGVTKSLYQASGVGGVSRHDSQVGSSPVLEKSSVSTPGPAALHDTIGSGFRRRCYTLDSQLPPSPSASGPAVDRSQERLPRFIRGVAHFAPSRRSPAMPLNKSFEVDNPSPALLRPHVRPLTPDLSPCHQPHGSHDARILVEQLDSKTEEAQQRVRALEEMQRRLEEEHALQMSLLMAEQEREQQHLRQELVEKERRLREQGCGQPLSGGMGRDQRSESYPSCPDLSPALSPADRSPGDSGQNMGFSSPQTSSCPTMQPPACLWGPIWGASAHRGRHSQVVTVEQQRALCHLAAITRGFLTRRLLQTEKVKQLRQTVQDTQDFILSFQTEALQKKGAISAQDLSLQERVRAQLRAARYDIHDIFFEISLEERLALLKLDRDVRTEKKLREMEKARTPKDRVLSAATQRSLDRKKRVGESPGQARKVQQKPKSPPTNRVLKPNQGQNAPVAGQLNRQGSWYRKAPEDRVKRSDSLKKQHSLG